MAILYSALGLGVFLIVYLMLVTLLDVYYPLAMIAGGLLGFVSQIALYLIHIKYIERPEK